MRTLSSVLFHPTRYFTELANRPPSRWRTVGITALLAVALSSSELIAMRSQLSLVEAIGGLVLATMLYFAAILLELAACLWFPIRWRAGLKSRAWEVTGLVTLPVVACALLTIPIALFLPIAGDSEALDKSWFRHLEGTLLATGGLWGLGVLKGALDALAPGRSEVTLATALVVGALVNLALRFAEAAIGVISVLSTIGPAA